MKRYKGPLSIFEITFFIENQSLKYETDVNNSDKNSKNHFSVSDFCDSNLINCCFLEKNDEDLLP